MSRLFMTDDMKSYIRRRVKMCAVVQQMPSFFVSYNFKRFINPEKNLICRQEYIHQTKIFVAETGGTYLITKIIYDRSSGEQDILVEMVAKDTTTKPANKTKSTHPPKGDRN